MGPRGKIVLYRNLPPPPYMIIDATQDGAGIESPPFMVRYLFHETAQISRDLSGGDLGNGRQNILPG